MSIDRTIKKLTKREHYAADYSLVLQQNDYDKETTLGVRRVRQEGAKQDELQIEITIIKRGEKRITRMDESFILPPELAVELAEACLKIRK